MALAASLTEASCWPTISIAIEASQSLTIRAYLKAHLDIARTHMYASSCWQIGQTEDAIEHPNKVLSLSELTRDILLHKALNK
mgnify:FL=1